MEVKEIVKFLEWVKETTPVDMLYRFGDKRVCDWKYMVNKNIELLKELEAYKQMWEELKDIGNKNKESSFGQELYYTIQGIESFYNRCLEFAEKRGKK